MGLDFGLIKVKKGDRPNWTDENELAYGRKSWELANFFKAVNENCDYVPITLYTWNNFIEMLEPIGDQLEVTWKAFNIENNLPNDYPETIFTDKEKTLIAQYEYWYNSTWHDEPTLGYGFSVNYMLSFWDVRDIVRKLLTSNKYDVYAIASY